MAKDKVYTADMGQPPQDIDGKSAGKTDKKDRPEQLGEGIVVKKAKGGADEGGEHAARAYHRGPRTPWELFWEVPVPIRAVRCYSVPRQGRRR